MIEIKRLQTVYVVAPDLSGSADFYSKVFGWVPKFSDPGRWIQYSIQGTGFALSCSDEGVPKQAGAVPVFEVSDLDGVESLVRAAGGRVMDLRDMGAHGRVQTMLDPGGNAFQLFCKAKEA